MKKYFLLCTLLCFSLFGKAQMPYMTCVMLEDSVKQGPPLQGYEVVILAHVTNNTSSPINIQMDRIVNDIPAGWQSYFCLITCQVFSDSNATITIDGDSTEELSFHFVVSSNPDTGHATLRMICLESPTEIWHKQYTAFTTSTVAIGDPNNQFGTVVASPSVVKSGSEINFTLTDIQSRGSIQLSDLNGKLLKTVSAAGSGQVSLATDGLASGIYLWKYYGDNGFSQAGKVVVAE